MTSYANINYVFNNQDALARAHVANFRDGGPNRAMNNVLTVRDGHIEISSFKNDANHTEVRNILKNGDTVKGFTFLDANDMIEHADGTVALALAPHTVLTDAQIAAGDKLLKGYVTLHAESNGFVNGGNDVLIYNAATSKFEVARYNQDGSEVYTQFSNSMNYDPGAVLPQVVTSETITTLVRQLSSTQADAIAATLNDPAQTTIINHNLVDILTGTVIKGTKNFLIEGTTPKVFTPFAGESAFNNARMKAIFDANSLVETNNIKQHVMSYFGMTQTQGDVVNSGGRVELGNHDMKVNAATIIDYLDSAADTLSSAILMVSHNNSSIIDAYFNGTPYPGLSNSDIPTEILFEAQLHVDYLKAHHDALGANDYADFNTFTNAQLNATEITLIGQGHDVITQIGAVIA